MSSSADKNKLHKAGGFHIEKIEVITSKGIVVDLLGILVHITFFEDIQTTSITGSCIINDMLVHDWSYHWSRISSHENNNIRSERARIIV